MASRITRSASKASSTAVKQAAAASSPPARSPSKRSRPTSATTESFKQPPTTPKRAKSAHKKKEPESPYVPPTPNTERRIHDMVESAEREGEKEHAVLLHPELTFEYQDAKDHLTRVDPRFGVIMDQLPCVLTSFLCSEPRGG